VLVSLQYKTKIMNRQSYFIRLSGGFIFFFAIMVLVLSGCKKNPADAAAYGNTPRKEVPDPFVGSFIYVTSTGGYVNQYGNYVPKVAQGLTLNIRKDGTGTSHYYVETNSYGGVRTTDEIRTNCTFEITKTSGNLANIIIHYVSGKNYHNGVLRHDLDASKLYPNGDTVWNDVEYGVNSSGKTIFIVGSGNNSAQFTKQ
jgi:hypothetical protein